MSEQVTVTDVPRRNNHAIQRRALMQRAASQYVEASVALLGRTVLGLEPGTEAIQGDARLNILAAKLRNDAAMKILDRVFGRPTTTIEKESTQYRVDAVEFAKVMQGMSDQQLDALQTALHQLKVVQGPDEQPAIETTATPVSADDEDW